MTEPKITYLKDYKAPEYFITDAFFVFDLFEDKAIVSSKLIVKKNEDAPLVLNGEHQKLLSVAVDGKKLDAKSYAVTDETLTLNNLPESFELAIETELEPQNNESCEGLYKSAHVFCTQNEPQGFRRITYFLDRPDVMAKYTTKVIADKSKYPVLLSNGNPSDAGDLDGGRHFVTYVDPFPKPSYLFALVAGDLDVLKDTYQTKSGRTLNLHIYVDKGNLPKCDYAMGALKRAMKWDEDTYGLECDLDTYMIVAVDAFNMGAMENKGLNIFNSQYILADPKSATDGNYEAIESVIGHEYFHNWTGNRVTCRDWFQITLKEGLTIFRDQGFSADMTSQAVKRVSDVRLLRDHQFVEDAGPNAHPIRPQSYMEINNFYTVTIYEKGSEVIKMIETLIGVETFRKGITKYFELFDGKAVTTDDFVSAMEQTSGKDLTQFKNWYNVPGTPICKIQTNYDKDAKKLTLVAEQLPPPASADAKPYHFPLSVGFLGKDGKDLIPTQVLEMKDKKHQFEFENIPYHPVPSLLRNFSAPVNLQYEYTPEELMFLFAHDSDGFNRFEAGQRLALRSLESLIRAYQSKEVLAVDERLIDAFGKLIQDESIDPAFKSECLVLPSVTALTERMGVCDFKAAFEAREFLVQAIAKTHQTSLFDIYQDLSQEKEYKTDQASIGRRTLKNTALAFLTSLGEMDLIQLAWKQFESAQNMTDEIAALSLLCSHDFPQRMKAIDEFYDKWKHDTLVMNKWFAVQASSKLPTVLNEVKGLEKNPAYDAKNPNKIRSLVGVFARNLINFHHESGEGYRYITDKILEVDGFNPLVAARMAEAYKKFSKLDSVRKPLMGRELERILAHKKLSRDVYEIISKTLSSEKTASK